MRRELPFGAREETKRKEDKHLRNSCGSESGKGERKRTAKPSKRNLTDGMRNQPVRKRKDQSDERSEGAAGKFLGNGTVKRAERKNRG